MTTPCHRPIISFTENLHDMPMYKHSFGKSGQFLSTSLKFQTDLISINGSDGNMQEKLLVTLILYFCFMSLSLVYAV